jgi:hypothetical protein
MILIRKYLDRWFLTLNRLGALKNSLTNDEIRFLRSQLNEITFQTDICGNLPCELLLMVTSYLSLDDIISARNVSHRWREALSAPQLCIELVQRYFPWTWEKYQNQMTPNLSGQDAEKAELPRWLHGVASMYYLFYLLRAENE